MSPPHKETTTGANVRAEIARQFLTQKQVAEKLGLSQQSMSQRIHGQVQWQDRELEKLARILKVPMSKLKGEKP